MKNPAASQANRATTRSAMLGLAEHVWNAERSRWILRPRISRILALAATSLALLYLSVAWIKYAENKWVRDCDDTSYADMCVWIFPDKVPGTKIVWTPASVHAFCERVRDRHRAKLAAVMLEKAKTCLKEKQWSKAFLFVFNSTKLDPANKESRLLASQILFALNRDDDAMQSMEDALTELIANPEFLRAYIVASFSKERYTRLLGVAKYHLGTPNLNKETREMLLLAVANCQFVRGEFDACSITLADPDIARTRDAFTLRVRTLKELGRADEALGMVAAAAARHAGDAELAFEQINLLMETGDTKSARAAASLHMIRASDSPAAKLRYMELVADEDPGRLGELISEYKSAFGKKPGAMVLLAEFAATKGMSELCLELERGAGVENPGDEQRMRLLYIESHLAKRRYLETVRLVDELFVENPDWLAHTRLQFDSLRMVAHFALGREDTGEIAFKRIYESTENLQPKFMEIVAHRLVEAGRPAEAVRVMSLCRERNPDSVSALGTLVAIHLESGGTPETPAYMREYLGHRRPPRKILLDARRVLASDAYLYEPHRDRLVADIEKLIQGVPVLPEAPPTPPTKKDRD